MSIYHLYGYASAVTEGVSSCDIQFDGDVVACHLSAKGTFDAANDNYGVEVSFLSSASMDKNDARGLIFCARAKAGVVTSGGQLSSINQTLSGVQIPVVAGERIYIHIPEYDSAGQVVVSATLYVRDSVDVNIRRRR